MAKKITEPEEMILKMAADSNNYAAVYARKSNLSNEGHSIATQLDLARTYSSANNLIIFKEYHEVISATKNNIHSRPQLDSLLKDASNGNFKHLILYRRDRLARNSKDFLILKKKFRKFGVKIHYTADTTVADDSPLSDFIENILMAVAELEPNNIASRIAAGKASKRENGFYDSPKATFGFRKISGVIEGTQCSIFSVDEESIDIVKNIFETYIDLDDVKNFSELKQNLIKNTPEVNCFSPSKLENLILNPIYCGIMFRNTKHKFKDGNLIDISNNEVLEFDLKNFIYCKNVTPIIDKETWFKAIYKYLSLNAPTKNIRETRKDLFKNKVYCNKCNELLIKKNDRYSCTCCPGHSTTYDKILDSLNRFLDNNLFYSLRLSNYIKDCKKNLNFELNNNKNKLKQNISSQSQYVELYIENNTISNETIRKILVDLKDEEIALRQLILEVENKISKLSSLSIYETENILQSELKNNNDFLKIIIDSTIEKVMVHGKDSIALHSKEKL
jgi:DNA invertase Pin-like site-specific DNA recombinase